MVSTMYNSAVSSDTGALSLKVENVGNYKNNLKVSIILTSNTGVQISQDVYTFNGTTVTE